MVKATITEVRTGAAGTAQRVRFERGAGDPIAWSATLDSWFLTCPGQSVAWDKYALHIIHLRPIPGSPPAHVRVPGATHEVMLLALDPYRQPRPDSPATWRPLQPINLQEQIELPSDTDAVELLSECADAVVDGRLWAEAPLAGQVEPWRSTLIQTSAHIRGERHGDLT